MTYLVILASQAGSQKLITFPDYPHSLCPCHWQTTSCSSNSTFIPLPGIYYFLSPAGENFTPFYRLCLRGMVKLPEETGEWVERRVYKYFLVCWQAPAPNLSAYLLAVWGFLLIFSFYLLLPYHLIPCITFSLTKFNRVIFLMNDFVIHFLGNKTWAIFRL